MGNNIVPLLSIITVCYNSGKEIEKTILSVLSQQNVQLEYIVIDGGSGDNTLEILKKYSDRISYWVSEPDNGIYDAMNKGINEAHGEYIAFLNAGDKYYSVHSLADLFNPAVLLASPDVVYGLIISCFSYGKFILHPKAIDNFPNEMPIAHPATFVRLSLMKKYYFDVRYKIAADYDFLYKLFKDKCDFMFVDALITEFESETGISNTLFLLTQKETALINGRYNCICCCMIYFKFFVLKTKNLLLSMLPKRASLYINKYIKMHDSNYSLFKS